MRGRVVFLAAQWIGACTASSHTTDAAVDAAPDAPAVDCTAFTTQAACEVQSECEAIVGIDVSQVRRDGSLCFVYWGPALGARFVQCLAPYSRPTAQGVRIDPADGHCLMFNYFTDAPRHWVSCDEVLPQCTDD